MANFLSTIDWHLTYEAVLWTIIICLIKDKQKGVNNGQTS